MTVPTEPQLYVGDRFVPASQATVSVFDRGFLYGDGVFETVRAYAGRIFHSDTHFERWRTAAGLLGIRLPLSRADWHRLLTDCVARNGGGEMLIRVCLTRGSGPPVPDPTHADTPLVVMIPRPAPARSLAAWQRGIHAVVSQVEATPAAVLHPAIKSHSFASHVMALGAARRQAVDEALLCDRSGRVVEGSISNLFGVWAGQVRTPPLAHGALPGVTRSAVLALAAEAGLPCQEGAIYKHDLAQAEALWVTNTGWEVMPVTRLNNRPVAGGRPAAICGRLQQALVTSGYAHTGDTPDLAYNTDPSATTAVGDIPGGP